MLWYSLLTLDDVSTIIDACGIFRHKRNYCWKLFQNRMVSRQLSHSAEKYPVVERLFIRSIEEEL